MSAVGINAHRLSVIDRTAIRIGTRLAAWGRTRSARRLERTRLERYRAGYDDRLRDAAAWQRAGLLP